MTVTAQQVKELRERTGAGMMECKKALTQTNGDIEEAIEELRKRGIAKAAKRAGNETTEGKIMIKIHDNKAYVVSVGCETDFVSRNEEFSAMTDEFMKILQDSGDVETAKEKIEAIRTEYGLKLGENIQILKLDIIEGEVIGYYRHTNKKVGAVVVCQPETPEEKITQIAMHVTATNPNSLSPDDIPKEEVEKEKNIYLEQMKNDPKNANKPENILEKIISGKIKKFKEENSLLTQNFVVDPNQTVEQFIGKKAIQKFYRYAI